MANPVRGSTIFFNVPTADSSGDAVTPDSATLYLVYHASGGTAPVHVTQTMTCANGGCSASWESSVAVEGPVRVSVRAMSSGTTIASDFTFTLDANEANPLPT